MMTVTLSTDHYKGKYCIFWYSVNEVLFKQYEAKLIEFEKIKFHDDFTTPMRKSSM